MNPYIGHESQLYGIEEHRLAGGKGDGMRLLEVNNGKGLELTISLDRCADISRLKYREIRVRLDTNEFVIHDTIKNTGDSRQPFEILYHMNMGYPLLDEDSVIEIPSVEVVARDAHALKGLANWKEISKPQAGFVEQCYYHLFETEGKASVYQPKQELGLEISFDPKQLDGFVEWKMLGVRDYVLGLECGNCYPDGRDVMRKKGMLKFLEPGEKKEYEVNIKML